MIRRNILILLLTTVSFTLFGQSDDIWTAFWNEDTTLIGYKDKNGVIKIEPRFSGLSNMGKFENIIGVIEEINETWSSYYLTKAGKIVGRSSLHFFDFKVDCENEGFIRFRDNEMDKVGMFNRNGDIAIPAEYNDMTRIKNGMAIAIKGAEKHWKGEIYSWVGGEEVLIDTLNHVLIENFSYTDDLSFFSLEKTSTPHADTIRKSFLAKDGNYYSFIDFEKEFEQWLKKDLIVDLTSEKLIDNSYDTITWRSSTGWTGTDRRKFVTDNFFVLRNGMSEILNPECKFFISSDSFFSFMHDDNESEKYYNNCNEFKDWIYPAMKIVISHGEKKDYSQNHYTFLRTDDGYKLISVSIRNDEIK